MTPLVAAIVTAGTIGAAFLAYLGGRYAVRQSVRANRDGNSAEWERRYRAGAERHLEWDGELRGVVRHLQDEINDLRREAGLEPREFEAIPPAPSLFPQPPNGKD